MDGILVSLVPTVVVKTALTRPSRYGMMVVAPSCFIVAVIVVVVVVGFDFECIIEISTSSCGGWITRPTGSQAGKVSLDVVLTG